MKANKQKFTKINKKIFIELYNEGKSDIELADMFDVGERTIQSFEARLRKDGKIKYRSALPSSRTVSTASKLSEPVRAVNWKITKSKKIPKKNKIFSTYLVIADNHIPYENVSATKSILKLMDDVNFDGFIILGDFMDMSPISHWLKNKKKTLENKRMVDDYVEGNRILDEFDKRLPKNCDKRFFYGNHEDWYYQLIEEYPALEGLLDPQVELKLEERGYKVYSKLNHIERIGRLSLTHGIYHSQNFVKKHIDELKTNVMIGHLHTPRQRFASSPAKEIAIAGYSVGCLSDLSPAYQKNRPNSWVHGFAVVYFYDNGGYFDVDLKRIVRGKFIFNDKLYDGNK